MSNLDRRTKAAQIAVSTKAAIIADVGGEANLSTLELLQAENAAMAAAVLRDMQIKWISGEEVSVSDMVSIENTFNRTAAALGTKRRPKDVQTIEAYLKRGD